MSGFDVILKPAAVRDMDRLRKHDAVMVADGIEAHLTDDPTKASKTRIKKLKGLEDPDYRLRVQDFRIFYNVDENRRKVWILRVLHKEQTHKYYKEIQS